MPARIIIAGLVIAAAAATSYAATGSGEGKKERLICKRDKDTGSNVRARRTCLTAAEWKIHAEYNRQHKEDWQNAIDGAARNN